MSVCYSFIRFAFVLRSFVYHYVCKSSVVCLTSSTDVAGLELSCELWMT